jgi:hypothetical protein
MLNLVFLIEKKAKGNPSGNQNFVEGPVEKTMTVLNKVNWRKKQY